VPQAQHHLTEGQHHFERSENIIPHEAAQMNEFATSRKIMCSIAFCIEKHQKLCYNSKKRKEGSNI
jgi:hypothetical protein